MMGGRSDQTRAEWARQGMRLRERRVTYCDKRERFSRDVIGGKLSQHHRTRQGRPNHGVCTRFSNDALTLLLFVPLCFFLCLLLPFVSILVFLSETVIFVI